MTQNARLQKRYDEEVSFIEGNKRNQSKYAPNEKLLVLFLKVDESL